MSIHANAASIKGVKVLLLGGSGLIGKPVAEALVAAGAQVTVLSRRHLPAPEGASALCADRHAPNALAEALGTSHFDLTIDLLVYTEADLALLRPHLASLGDILVVSTGQVYLVSPEARAPYAEDDASFPVSPEPPPGTRAHANWRYGVGKRSMETALAVLGREQGRATLALRVPIVIGAGDRTERFWSYVERLRDGSPMLIPGQLDQPLRFVWSEDIARVVVAIATKGIGAINAQGLHALNWAQPDVLSVAEFIRLLAVELGVQVPQLVPCTQAQLDAAGLDASCSPYVSRWCSVVDPTRAQQLLQRVATPCAESVRHVLRAMVEASTPNTASYALREAEVQLAANLLRNNN